MTGYFPKLVVQGERPLDDGYPIQAPCFVKRYCEVIDTDGCEKNCRRGGETRRRHHNCRDAANIMHKSKSGASVDEIDRKFVPLCFYNQSWSITAPLENAHVDLSLSP
jgi:hypothetical protein